MSTTESPGASLIDQPTAAQPAAVVGRRDWLKSAMTAGVVAASVAALSRAEAQEAAAPKADGASAEAGSSGATKVPTPESETKPLQPLVTTTLSLSAGSDDPLAAIEVMQWQYGLSVNLDKDGETAKDIKSKAIAHQDITAFIAQGNASPALHKLAWTGSVVGAASVTIRQLDKSGSKTLRSYRADLENVTVTSIRLQSDAPDATPMETLTLRYERIRWTLENAAKIGPDGKPSVTTTDWNMDQAKAKKSK